MILKLKDIKDVSAKILASVDSSDLSVTSDVLELQGDGSVLNLCISNGEYYVKVKVPVGESEKIHATVKANLFLKLVSQLTTEVVEFNIVDNSLVITGNGVYKLPLIFMNDSMLELPKILVSNVSESFVINTDIFKSISVYNSKEMLKNGVIKPVQKFYYIDSQGCITYSSGACVNQFTLEKPVKFLLSGKLIKLLKLFSSDQVKFTIGYDRVSPEIMQTKVKFTDQDVELTAILVGDNAFVKDFPADAIRGRVSEKYPYTVTFNKAKLLDTIDRLLMFTSNSVENKTYSTFTFSGSSVTLSNENNEYSETIEYSKVSSDNISYSAILNLKDIKLVLDGSPEQFVDMSFGNEQATLFERGSVKNIIPEIVMF